MSDINLSSQRLRWLVCPACGRITDWKDISVTIMDDGDGEWTEISYACCCEGEGSLKFELSEWGK